MGNVKHAFVAQSIDGGVVFTGPTGALTLPAAAITTANPLSAPWKSRDLGTLSEDGLGIQYKRSSKKEKDFDGATYITVQDDFADGFKATFLDIDNHNLVESVFGADNVVIESATVSHGEQITIYHAAEQLPFEQAVITTRSGKKFKTYTAEICQVSEIAEIKDVYNATTKYEVTWEVLRGTDGKFLKEYRDNGEVLVPSAWDVEITGSPTGGSFPLTVTKDGNSETATGIVYNATTGAVKAAIEGLSNVPNGDATVTGTPGAWHVVLASGGVLSTTGGSFTGGSSPAVTVEPA